MTQHPPTAPLPQVCSSSCHHHEHIDYSHHNIVWVRSLAWISLILVSGEASLGLWQGISTRSIALLGWALGSCAEMLTAGAVIWRFNSKNSSSHHAERYAQIIVAWSFWLSAPYIAIESVHHLITAQEPQSTRMGIIIMILAATIMPIIATLQRRLAIQLDSAATAGEGIQNYLCAIQAITILISLLIEKWWPYGWWLDPLVGLAIAAVSLWQGWRSWNGKGCGC